GGGFGGEAVGGDGDSLVEAVEQVERVDGEFEAVTLPDVDLANQTHVGGGVVGSGEGVAAVAGQAVVVVVAVLIGIAGDTGIHGAAAACGDDAGEFPVVEQVAEELMLAMKGARLEGKCGDESIALVGDARSALGARIV